MATCICNEDIVSPADGVPNSDEMGSACHGELFDKAVIYFKSLSKAQQNNIIGLSLTEFGTRFNELITDFSETNDTKFNEDTFQNLIILMNQRWSNYLPKKGELEISGSTIFHLARVVKAKKNMTVKDWILKLDIVMLNKF